jgi:DNA polymerase-1
MSWNIDVPTAEYYDLEHKPGLTAAPLEHLIREIEATKEVAIDTETTGLVKWKDIPLYWSLAWGQRRCTLNARALPAFRKIFADPERDWIFANAKYDSHILGNVGIQLAGRWIDTQVMHALLYEEQSHKLKDMAMAQLGWRWSDFQDTFGKINKNQSAEDMIRKAEANDFGLLVEYAANDAWGTLNVKHELKKQLAAANTWSLFKHIPPYINTLEDLFYKTEVPYTKVLWTCERNGILIDRDYLNRIAPEAQQEIDDIQREIVHLTNNMVNNPNSTQQLLAYFQSVGAPLTKLTKGGKTGVRNLSLDAEVLEFLSSSYKVASLTLRIRELSKLKGTYIDGINELLDPISRLHTNFNQDVARTGRLSSSDPNAQNIPKPENDKWKLRGAFVAPEGHELIVADYAQLEMRLLADGSREAGMIEVIKRGWDIHMGNAAMIYNLPYDEIEAAKKTEKLVKSGKLPPEAMTERVEYLLRCRAEIKNIGFGLVYGMGDSKLARDLGITKAEATAKSQNFMAKYPAVASFKSEMLDDARQYGYVFTIMGRRRNVSSINSYRNDDRSKAERIAVNTPIQGSAADVVRMAQINLNAASLDYRYGCKMLLQVHDELVFQCPKECVKEAKEEIKEFMEHPFCIDLSVPLAVDIGSGPSWMAAK